MGETKGSEVNLGRCHCVLGERPNMECGLGMCESKTNTSKYSNLAEK